MTWQGQSGNASFPGTTILQGIQREAANVTYSPDASAPIGGADVGVVVIGETPYAEFLGDVGVNGHTLDISAADRANIDTVCAAVKTCVVLDVAGRPQIITDELPKADAFVMSWLPGSEGAGVADVLFGKRAFTGKLPVTWPRSAAQEPINVGDAAYVGMFSVLPTLQGAGLGRVLLEACEARARAMRRKWLRLTVITIRGELIAWYERRGFRDTGHREPFPYGNPRFGLPTREDLEFEVLEKPL